MRWHLIKEVEFPSEDATLRGLLFLPKTPTKRPPVVIMAHGTSATVTMVADKYAQTFSLAGLAVLLYDHRNFGRSEGEPRQEINPWIQTRGYLDAVKFAERLDEVDPERIALWGDSYSGGQVIVVGAIEPRVKVIIAQVPVFGEKPPEVEPSRVNFDLIKEILLRGDVRGSPETTIGPMPVVSSDQAGTPSLLKPIQAFRWFIDFGGRAGTRWINSVTRVLPATPMPYHPTLCAPFVRAHTLLMVAPEDEMVHANYAVAKQAYELIPGPKHWYDIAGGHFGLLYYPSELFEEASRVQTEFLKKWL
jgi:pimeloyl-ACP methyl ester carboxylesterase